MASEFDNTIIEWLKAVEILESAKQNEFVYRCIIAPYVLKESRLETFSKTLQLGKGYRLQCTNTMNFKLDKVELVEEVIGKLSTMGYSRISKDLFKWKPTISETVYKQLPTEVKEIVDEILTIKPGAPQLKFLKPGDAE